MANLGIRKEAERLLQLQPPLSYKAIEDEIERLLGVRPKRTTLRYYATALRDNLDDMEGRGASLKVPVAGKYSRPWLGPRETGRPRSMVDGEE